jgi:predicted kinase
MNTLQQELVLIRGLPGSGKTTWAKLFVRDYYAHYEADMFFEFDGPYKFDASKLGEAHAWCLRKTKESLEHGQSVVVANTFSRLWEMKPYINLAERLFLPMRILVAKGNWPSVHRVPEEVVAKMVARWENVNLETESK